MLTNYGRRDNNNNFIGNINNSNKIYIKLYPKGRMHAQRDRKAHVKHPPTLKTLKLIILKLHYNKLK